MRSIRFLPLLAVVLVLSSATLVGCSKKSSTGGATSDTTGMGGPSGMTSESTNMNPPGGATQLTDAEIAQIVKTANDGDVANGKAAGAKSKNADVKTFARQMVNDHTAANKNVDALAKKLNLSLQDNPTSTALKQQVDAKRDSLKKLDGAAFDRAYMDAEVALHEQLLNDLDNTLIPHAQNADLKQLLQETRSVVENHLRMAKDVQSKLGGGAAQ